MSSRLRAHLVRIFAASVCLFSPPPVAAFTFSDGSTMQCIAHGKRVPEFEVPASEQGDFTGRAARSATGYRIVWNPSRLNALPPAVHDFLFFHECAHAQLVTSEELVANCAGLKAMRAAGRGGLAVESRLAAFYGPGNSYWVQTLACANAVDGSPPQQDGPAAGTPRTP